MAPSTRAASRTVRVIGPGVSWLWLIGTTRVRLTRPTLGLKPTMPLMDAGQVHRPAGSVPAAAGTIPAATAAPLPREEPHGFRFKANGLCVWPPTALHPEIELLERMFAHSERLVLPTITPPAARSRATRGASRLVTFWASARLPAVVGSGPALSILSLMRIGIPSSGPFTLRRSTARAWSIAVGSVAITALPRGFSARMRCSAAAVFDWALGCGAASAVPPARAQ